MGEAESGARHHLLVPWTRNSIVGCGPEAELRCASGEPSTRSFSVFCRLSTLSYYRVTLSAMLPLIFQTKPQPRGRHYYQNRAPSIRKSVNNTRIGYARCVRDEIQRVRQVGIGWHAQIINQINDCAWQTRGDPPHPECV